MQEKLKFITICANSTYYNKAPFIIQTRDGNRLIDSLNQYSYCNIDLIKSHNYSFEKFNDDLILLDSFNWRSLSSRY